MAIMAAKPKSRTNAPSVMMIPEQQLQQPVTQPQQPQQQQPLRRRRQSLSAGIFWKLGVPLILLLSVFTILDRVGRVIEDMYSTTSTLSKTIALDVNDITDTITTTTTVNEDRISERRKNRDQRRDDLVNDKERKHQSSREWLGSSLGNLSTRIDLTPTPPKISSSSTPTPTPPKISSSSTPTDPALVYDDEVLLFDYNQPVIRTNTTLNEPTADYSHAKMIVFVMSARENFERRAMIRQTWGKGHAVYFVTGGQPSSELHRTESSAGEEQTDTSSWFYNNKKDDDSTSIQDRLVQEQAMHQDLIDSIHLESYRGLPHKLKFAYQWILQHCPDVQWLVKVDDDTVVRIDTLQAVVLDNLNHKQPIVAGRIMVDDPVHKTGKWAELLYTESETYPYWPQGSRGHAVSRPVAEYIAQKADAGELTLYQGEDTSLGIWLHEASAKKELHVTWFKSQYFTDNGDCHSRQWLIIGHQLSPAQMKACYDTADEWTEEYRNKVSKNLWHMHTQAQNDRSFKARRSTNWGN
jgi:hypothetical protein